MTPTPPEADMDQKPGLITAEEVALFVKASTAVAVTVVLGGQLLKALGML